MIANPSIYTGARLQIPCYGREALLLVVHTFVCDVQSLVESYLPVVRQHPGRGASHHIA
jgi:hypothetical protein